MSPMVRGHTHKYQLLGVSTTTIGERAVHFFTTSLCDSLNTTVCAVTEMCELTCLLVGSTTVVVVDFYETTDHYVRHWKPP